MKKVQRYLLYLLFFSINFEMKDTLDTGIDFLATKITIVLYLFSSLFNFKLYYNFNDNKHYLFPLVIFIVLLIIASYLNQSYAYSNYFDLPIILNILVLMVALNHSKKDPDVLLKGLYFFVLSSIILTILFLNGIQTELIEGRISIFNNNENDLGVKLTLSIFILISFMNTNILKKYLFRYIFLLPLALMVFFIVKTGSRVSFISLSLGFIVYVLFLKLGFLRKSIFIVFATIVSIGIYYFFIEGSLLAERLRFSVIEGDLSGRDIRWEASLLIINKNFLWGIGKTGYSSQIEALLGFYTSPHNVIIEVFVYTGLIGFIAMFMFFFRVSKCIINSYKVKGNILPLLLAIPIAGLIISGQIMDSKIVWLIFAYIIADGRSNIKSIKRKFRHS